MILLTSVKSRRYIHRPVKHQRAMHVLQSARDPSTRQRSHRARLVSIAQSRNGKLCYSSTAALPRVRCDWLPTCQTKCFFSSAGSRDLMRKQTSLIWRPSPATCSPFCSMSTAKHFRNQGPIFSNALMHIWAMRSFTVLSTNLYIRKAREADNDEKGPQPPLS